MSTSASMSVSLRPLRRVLMPLALCLSLPAAAWATVHATSQRAQGAGAARTVPAGGQRVEVSTSRAYDTVRAALDRQLGSPVDQARFRDLIVRRAPWREVKSVVDEMAGPAGFTVFYRADHGAVGSLAGRPYRASQYLLGNPITARSILIRDVAAALPVPFRLAIYEKGGRTHIDYERPSSFLKRFRDPRINAIGRSLDARIARVVSSVIH
jgi:uncharacterized protein (DUF302 family)